MRKPDCPWHPSPPVACSHCDFERCAYCDATVSYGEPCSSCGKTTTGPGHPPGRVTGERVAEGELRELLGSGYYFAPFDKLSIRDAAILLSGLE